MNAYSLVVEETIIDMLQDSGATQMDGDDIMVNLRELGGKIMRYPIKDQKAEFVALFMGDKIEKVMYIWLDGENVMNVPMNAEELERAMNNGSKEGKTPTA